MFITVYMTWEAFQWAAAFAEQSIAIGKMGLESAAMIAAVTAPVSALQGYVFKAYVEGRSSGESDANP